MGTGGVGSAFAGIARRRSFFEHCAVADYDPSRPEAVVAQLDDGRFDAHRVDASSREDVARLIRETSPDAVLNAVDPVFNMAVFDACLEARVHDLVNFAPTAMNGRPLRVVWSGRGGPESACSST